MQDILRWIVSNIWYAVLIALFFGGSIFVHELGHFLAARRRGLKIERFSIGFGPKIFGWTRDGIEYRVSWIPLGGYVALPQLADMRGIEGDPASDTTPLPPISFTSKMIVSVMGAVFNLIFAFALACVLWGIKQEVNAAQTTTRIGYVAPTVEITHDDGSKVAVISPAAEAHLEIGDTIKAIDGSRVDDFDDIQHAILLGAMRADDGRRKSIFTIERAGKEMAVTLYPQLAGEDRMRQVGIRPYYNLVVEDVRENSPGETIGLRKGDVIVSLDGTPIHNDQTYSDIVLKREGRPLDIVVKRGTERVTLVYPEVERATIVAVLPDSLASTMGLKPKDAVVAYDGTPVQSTHDFQELASASIGRQHELTVLRGQDEVKLTVPPRPSKETKLGVMLVDSLGVEIDASSKMIRIDPFTQFEKHVRNTIHTFSSLLNRKSDVGISDMSGPVGIIRVYYYAAHANIRFVIWLTILVNINLAIFNLMPIPVLDGGHMLFATIAKIRGRAIPPSFLMATQSTFMVLLLSMVVYVTFFDFRRSWRDMRRDDAPQQQQEQPADSTSDTAVPATP